MGAVDLHRRILELEEQVNNLSRDKRELEEKIKELTPRKMFTAALNFNKHPTGLRRKYGPRALRLVSAYTLTSGLRFG
jgi:hypothetical protein